MLEIYYTGAAEMNGAQPYSSLSLGGFASCSLVPNGIPGALFPELSPESFFPPSRLTFVLAVRNATGKSLTGLRSYVSIGPGSLGVFSLGFSVPVYKDKCSDVCSERLSLSSSLPQGTVLSEAADESTSLSLPDLPFDGLFFLFLSREVQASYPFSTTASLLLEEEKPLALEDKAILKFFWD